MKTIVILFLCCFCFCSPFRGLQEKQFTYPDGGENRSIRLIVPRHFKKEERSKDNAGNEALVFSYPDGAVLYFAYADTLKEFQPINKDLNLPLPHPAGGWMYKGMDSSSGLFWREVKQGHLRFGYRNVSPSLEIKFDTSVNYASYPPLRRRLRRE